ncbi:MAG TPA: YkgJ family cysteine cluster protein [Candidatus Bilamarchaeum sp.]|nr:YkgJ family cysteine cluster protein [Candidatus Bilamarchaeum sp.]
MGVTVKIDGAIPASGGAKPETNMCAGCPGYCCKLLVDLTSYDLFRLVILEKKDALEFVEAVYAARDDAYAFRAEGSMVKLVLRHKENGYCVFFNEKEKLGCSVEEGKPAICLMYPFCGDGRSFQSNALCPSENRRRADYAKMSKEVYMDAIWEFQRYQEIIDDWNTKSDGSENTADFLNFAAAEMELEKSPLGRQVRRLKRSIRRLQASVIRLPTTR